MIFVDRNSINIPEVFFTKEMEIANNRLKEFYNLPSKSRSQKRYSRPFEFDLREPIKVSLHSLFRSKCAYCESIVKKGSKTEYDHFRPKSGARGYEKEFSQDHYWWLTYNWNNFYLACSECNRYKATWFPVAGKRAKSESNYEDILKKEKPLFIDPCKDMPSEHFSFNNSGEIEYLSERGKVTIELLNLNRSKLVELRKNEIQNTFGEWEELSKLWRKKENNWSRINEIVAEWREIISERSSRPYVAATKRLILDRIQTISEIEEHILDKTPKSDLQKIKTKDPSKKSIAPKHKVSQKKKEVKISVQPVSLSISMHEPTIKTNQVFLERLELKNYKCFDYIDLNLSQTRLDKSDGESWHLILGENGVGKSSILKAISIALLDKSSIEKLSDEINSKKLLKKGKQSGHIKLTYNQGKEVIVNFSKKDNSIKTSVEEPLTNIIAYGSVRLLPKGDIRSEQSEFSNIRVGNLFDYSIALRDANEWLLSRSQVEFDREATTLKELMLLNEDCVLRRINNKEIQVTFPDQKPISIDELSDGYKMVYAMAVDIMSSLSSENINYDLAHGIVLIDEIGTHLHPRWKMQVVERLRSSFPNLQFIVSTHEPLCLRGLGPGEVIVLAKNDVNEIIAIDDLPDPSELRIDQILTSEFFGLKSTFDPKTEQIFEEYYGLLAKDEKERDLKEKTRLVELSQLIPRIKHLGDNIRENLVYHVIDELLARKVKDEGMKMEDLKKEAVERVISIWEKIEQEG